jgi:large repetitive protein
VGGGAAEPAQEDVNDNGTLTSSTPTFSFQSVGANSRGLATLNGASYSFYMISAARVQFIALGSPASSVTAGVATLQTSTSFAATSLGGNSLLITNGNSTAGPISTAASFFSQANPNNSTGTFGSGGSGVLTQNNSGNVSTENFSGTYAVASNGRGTATLSTGQTYVFYLIGVNQGVIQETDDSIVSDGTLAGLAGGPFSTSNLAGGYAVQLSGVAAGIGEQDVVGQINLAVGTSNGQVATGTVDIDTANGAGALTAFTPTPGVAIPAGSTYTISNGQGPLNVTVAGTSLTFTAYFLSSSSLFLVRTDMTDTRVLHGNLYQDVSLSPAILSANSASFSVGVQGTFTVIATGNPAPTLTQTGTLPSGVTFDALTGVLSGTPAAGTGGTVNMSYPLQFTATNGIGSPAVQNFTLTVVYCIENGSGTCTPI